MLVLNRISSDENGTFGELLLDNHRIAVTCELPWVDNTPRKSCIPVGIYKIKRFNSPSKGRVFLLSGVPNRSMIEIHIANTPDELLGCIGVGSVFGTINGKKAVLNSRKTMIYLLEVIPDNTSLIITGCVG